MKSFILLLGIMVMAVAAHAEIYQWTDSQGGVHFTDNLNNVPATFRDKVQKVNVRPSIVNPDNAQQMPAAPPPQTAPSLYGGHDESWWRSSFAAIRNEIKTIQDGLPAKRNKFTELHRRYVIFSKPSDRVASNQVSDEIDRDEARIGDLNKQLADLDDAATRAGVPFQWRQ